MKENKQNDQNFLDDLLDHGLAQYAKSEPRPGLETRLLANLSTDVSRAEEIKILPVWIWPRLGWAAAVLLLVIGAAIFSMNLRNEKHGSPMAGNPKSKPADVHPTQAPTQKPNAINMNASHSTHVITATQEGVPAEKEPVRLAVFPSPSPLTEQEKYFLQFVRSSKRDDLVSMSRPDEPWTRPENKTDDDKIPNESRLKNTGTAVENVKN